MKSPRTYLICDFLVKTAGILTAVAVAVATFGIPLPIPLVKDTAAPFPCMNCGCGCVNAEMCWRQCCCFSPAEKLVWANKHGVKVPESVLDQVAVETNTNSAELAEVRPCCRQRVLAANVKSCCDRKSGSCTEAPAQQPPLTPGVLAIHALKCQGLSLSLSLLPPSIPTDILGFQLPLAPGENIVVAGSSLYQPPCFEAVVPPPESAT